MKVLIATGGTGGHIYPALALAEDLKRSGIESMFSGSGLSKNPFFDVKEPHIDVSSGSGLKQVFSLLKGIWQSYRLLGRTQSQVVVGFGSFHCFPLLFAAKMKKVPIILFAADTLPGKVIRWFAPYAEVTGIHFPQTEPHLHGKSTLVKMPLRAGYTKNSIDRNLALDYFGLTGNQPILLVFGGSKGAHFLNTVVPLAMEKNKRECEIIHITGSDSSCNELKKTYQSLGILAAVKAFEDKMHWAWSIADGACSRAGAGSIAEALEFEVPSILIPYPFAMDDHQDKNADYFVSSGWGVKLREKDTNPNHLSEEIDRILLKKKINNFNNKSQITLADLVRDHLKEAKSC